MSVRKVVITCDDCYKSVYCNEHCDNCPVRYACATSTDNIVMITDIHNFTDMVEQMETRKWKLR